MGDPEDVTPQCPRCGLHPLEPAGEASRPYWWCPDCGPIRTAA